MKRIVGIGNVIGFVSLCVFLTTEFGMAAAATVWSVSGLLHLGNIATTVLAVAIAVPSIYGIAWLCVLAYQAQADPNGG